jgi:hypothetical protein
MKKGAHRDVAMVGNTAAGAVALAENHARSGQDAEPSRRMLSRNLYPAHADTIPGVDVPVFVWMFIVLKVPIVAALLLIYWAVQEPEPTLGEDDGGSRRPRDPKPRPKRPRSPRRGPHVSPPPSAPARVRIARGRRPIRHPKR